MHLIFLRGTNELYTFNQKPDFDFAQNTATKLLLNQDITSLFVDIRQFDLGHNIKIDTIQNYSKVTGTPLIDLHTESITGAIVCKKHGINLILYDDDEPNERRKHWGITHEVGHVYLNHENDDRKSEIEAHFFAAQVVAPEIVLWGIVKEKSLLTSDDLYNHFNISHEAADKRISTLKKRGYYNYGAIDKELFSKYVPLFSDMLHCLAS